MLETGGGGLRMCAARPAAFHSTEWTGAPPRAICLPASHDCFSLRLRHASQRAAQWEAVMSSITADQHAAPAVDQAGSDTGPLEQHHLQYANYRAVAGSSGVTK